MHCHSLNRRHTGSASACAWFALILVSMLGCNPSFDGQADASVSATSSAQAKDTQAWLLYGVASDGTVIRTRIERSKAPPLNLQESEELSFSITEPKSKAVRHGRVLISDSSRVLFSEVDGPASNHHWDIETPMMWIPLGDATNEATVSLMSGDAPLASIAVPRNDWAEHSSHPLEEISVTGAPESRINIVIISDGYTADQADKFRNDSNSITDFLFSTRPYQEYRALFNVYRVVTESPESGADHPDMGIDVLNRFKSSFNCGGVPRALCADAPRVLNTVYGLLPETDQVLLVVNDDRYGGTGGQIATTSTHPTARLIAVHEFGHSLARLADEYETSTGNLGIMAPEANVSLSSVFDEIKWKHWIDDTTILPTYEPLATSNVEPIGAYEGARYYSSGIYRPAPSCKMRASESELCSVCVEASIIRFHSESWLIASSMPALTEPVNIARRTGAVEFQVELSDLADLNVRWLVDGEEVGTGKTLSLDPSAVGVGAKTLQVQVTHTTDLVRSDPDGRLTEELEWDLSDGEPDDEPMEEQSGCGCQQSSSSSTWLVVGLLLFAIFRRKRQFH